SSKAFGIPVVDAPDEVVPCDDRVDDPTNFSSGLNRDHSEKIEASGLVNVDTSADGVNIIPASVPEKTEQSNDKSMMKPLLAIFGIGGLLGWIVFRRK
ncbi:MAG: hypothetical protein JXR25_08600, partial [Pontiellaceae bacterium]|nr:hypothetical protein [Pontiellaceae bacterium]